MEIDDDIPDLVSVDQVTLKPILAYSSQRIPVTVLTGFLGSGKTTLLNYILMGNHGYKIAVIENELSGGLGIEGL